MEEKTVKMEWKSADGNTVYKKVVFAVVDLSISTLCNLVFGAVVMFRRWWKWK